MIEHLNLRPTWRLSETQRGTQGEWSYHPTLILIQDPTARSVPTLQEVVADIDVFGLVGAKIS